MSAKVLSTHKDMYQHQNDDFLPFFFAAYKDMVSRKAIRQNLWNTPGWDDCVANTGNIHPLILL